MSSAALDSSVTLDEVFAVLATKRVPLAPELAGYLVLEIAEQVDSSAGEVDPKSVFLGEEGTVAFVRPRGRLQPPDATATEPSVRSILGRLLEAGGSQSPALASAVRRKSGVGMEGLAAELETALIPVNRAAGRRALARLAREVRRVTLGVGRNALPSAHDFVQSKSSPPRAPISDQSGPGTGVTQPNDDAAPSTSGARAEVDQLIEQFGVTATGDRHHARAVGRLAGLEPTPAPVPVAQEGEDRLVPRPFAGDGRAGALTHERGVETFLARTALRVNRGVGDEFGDGAGEMPAASATSGRGRRLGHLAPVIVVCLIGVGAYVAYQLRGGAPVAGSPPLPASAPARASGSPAAACRGSLIVTHVPAHAEVLLGEGQAPVDVDKLPVGARLEFVATAEGYAPKRVVIPAGAEWDTAGNGRPRFEAAVQLDKSRSKVNTDAWPPGEPGSEVGGQGPPGIVHVVANPRGAEIWMLAGVGPEARLEQLPCDHDLDVLIAGPTTFRKRLHLTPADFRVEEGASTSGPQFATRVARASAD